MRKSGAILAGIASFEWRTTAGRPAFAAAAVGLAGLGALLSINGPGSGADLRNGPWAVAYATGFLGLVSVFAATLLSAPALLRDVEHRSEEIVFSTGVTKAAYLLGRFAGSFLVVATALALGVAGLAAGSLLLRPDPAATARLAPLSFLWSFAVLALPGALFSSALLFAVAALARSTAATYAAGAALYVLYWVAAILAGSPIVAGSVPWSAESARLAALLDPFGLSAFLEATRHWSLADRNARLLALEGTFLANRLLVLAAAGLCLAVAFRRFSFRLAPSGPRGPAGPEEAAVAASAPWRPARTAGPAFLPALVSTARVETAALLRSRPLAALFLLWVAALGIELSQELRSNELGTARLATTGLLVSQTLEPLGLFGTLVLLFFGAEVSSRERSARVSEVVGATPAPSSAFFLGKLAALAAVVAGIALSAAAVGTVLQLATGFGPIDLLPWLGLAWFGVVPLLLLAVLVLAVHAFLPRRGVGLLVSLAAVLFLHRGALGGPDHLLLRFAAFPEARWSDFHGFGPALPASAWFAGSGVALAALLALCASAAWPRGTDTRLLPRLRALPGGLGRFGRWGALVFLAALALVGGLAFRRTNVVNRYETAAASADWKAAYERAYKATESLPQPSATDLVASVELEPEARRARIAGRLRLANLSGAPIPSVSVALRRDVTVSVLALGGRRPSAVDERFAACRFDLARPMGPGESLDLAFDLSLERSGPRGDGEEYDLVSNGTYLHGMSLVPSIGYRASRELVDENERRERGLPPRAASEAELDAPAGTGRMTFDVTVTTPSDQLPVAPGVLVSSSVGGGRRVTRFRADRPVTAFFSVASARYAVARLRRGGVDVEVYHHPAHARNVARVLEAATAALDYCVSRYGAYPFPQLRIAEVPAAALGAGGFALPGVVYLSEERGFLIDADAPGRIDLLAKRVAHEVSHQWWGHQLSPAPGPGAAALVETLARHTELRVLSALRGPEALPPVLERERDRYLEGRTGGDEVPLVAVRDQAYLYYSKGALAMAALVDLAGAEAVDGALRGFLESTRASGSAPTARGLLDALLRATPPGHRPLVEEWWTRTSLPERGATADGAALRPGGPRTPRTRSAGDGDEELHLVRIPSADPDNRCPDVEGIPADDPTGFEDGRT